MKNKKICLSVLILGILITVLGIWLTFQKSNIEDDTPKNEKPTVGDSIVFSRSEALEIVKGLYENLTFYVKDSGKKDEEHYIFERLNRETDQRVADIYLHQETEEVKIRSVSTGDGGGSE